MPRRRTDPLVAFGVPFSGGGLVRPTLGNEWFVSTFDGSDSAKGTAEKPLATISEALDRAATHDVIYFKGKVQEEVVGSNLKFDIKIIGCGGLHHADQPGSGSTLYDYGAASWVAPASPTATTPLIEVNGRGWEFHNIMFDCPVDAAAIKLVNNSGSGTTEEDASHAVIKNCVFQQGKYGIQFDGPIGNTTIVDSTFAILSVAGGTAIYAATDGGPHFRNRILDNFFVPAATVEGNKGNQSHIDVALFSSLIRGNVFGTVESTGKYIDLTGGQDNVVCFNVFGGVYDTDDYVGATGDIWYQNAVAVKATTAPDGVTLAAPAAP